MRKRNEQEIRPTATILETPFGEHYPGMADARQEK